jgi:hypothetical protein
MLSRICHETKIIEDCIIDVPQRGHLTSALAERLHRSAAQLARIRDASIFSTAGRATLGHLVLSSPGNQFDRLSHPLAAAAIARQRAPMTTDPHKSLREQHAFEQINQRLKISRETPVSVLLFHALSPCFGIPNPRFRDMDNGWMNADSDGWRTRLPMGRAAQQRLIEIDRIVQEVDRSDDLFTAATLLVLFLNCHPFFDGNGRSSRVLFNVVLNTGQQDCPIFVPLNEFTIRASGGFQIRLLLAIRKGEWEPILAYMCDVIDIMDRLSITAPD